MTTTLNGIVLSRFLAHLSKRARSTVPPESTALRLSALNLGNPSTHKPSPKIRRLR